MLKEHGDKVSADVRETAIEEKKKALVAAKAGEDPKAIEKAVDELMEASQEIAKKLYEEAAKASAAGGAARRARRARRRRATRRTRTTT